MAVDERIRSILINPRLHGLPHARIFSAVLFALIIGINIILAAILSEANKQVNDVAVNVLSAQNFSSDSCEELEYSERVGYNFRSPFLTRASKAFLSIEVKNPKLLTIDDHLLRSSELEAIRSACEGTPYSFGAGDNPFTNYCLAGLPFVELLAANEEVDSEIVLRRQLNDLYVQFNFPNRDDNLRYRIFTTPVDEPGGAYNINVVVTTDNIRYDITVIPAFLDRDSSIEDLNDVTLAILVAIGSRQGTNDFMRVSLTTRFANCKQQSGLNTFEYFALLFDYAFIIEGFFTVFVALAILKCLGYDVYDSKGKIVSSRRRENKDLEVKPVKEVIEDKFEYEKLEENTSEGKEKVIDKEEKPTSEKEEKKTVEKLL